MPQVCPKCGHQRSPKDLGVPVEQCPKCGIIYSRYLNPSDRRAREEQAAVLRELSLLPPEASTSISRGLLPGEEIKVVLRGAFGQAMVATDRRVFVYKAGLMAGATFGHKMVSWDFANVNGIHIEVGFLTGVVAVQAPGVPSADLSYWSAGSKTDPARTPNAIPLNDLLSIDAAKKAVWSIRKLISEHQSPTRPPAAADGIPEQIRKLADLRDQGILTTAEFEAKKADLLRRL